MTTRTVKIAYCSFCDKSQDATEHIIAGPNDVHICNECVDICNKIIAEGRAKEAEMPYKTADFWVGEGK